MIKTKKITKMLIVRCRSLFLMGFWIVLSIICFLIATEISIADSVGGTVRGRNYNYFSITGNGATDMVACYQAQLGRKGRDIGFSTGWCDTILVDCAILTNQTDAIGTPVLNNMRSQIESRGGISINNINDIQAGDILFFSGHVALASDISHSYHGNIGSDAERPLDSKVRYLCTFGSGTYGCTDTSGFAGGSYQGAIRPAYTNRTIGTLDVGGILDGVNNYSTGEYGTFDVYINNELKANDVNDYANKNLKDGTTYRITDIKAKNGYSYDGSSQSFSGTITGGNTSIVWLPFNSCKLVVNGYLDKQRKDSLGAYGTFDVVLNGFTVCDDCNTYDQRVTNLSNYKITDIKAKNGYAYEGVYSGSLEGTIGSGTKSVRLSFYSLGELSCDWIETNVLPGNVSTANCEIQYNNHYQKKAPSSPGSGYSQIGSAITEYENSGAPYESEIELPTSPTTRKEVSYYYYHFCGSSTGVNADHTIRNGYVHYDSIADPNSVVVEDGYPHNDDTDTQYKYYKLKWKTGGDAKCKSGVTCDGSNGSHGERSYYWYRMTTYQDLKAVTYYTWVKDSGWTSSRDSSANSVTIRYRLKSGCSGRDITLPSGLKEIQSSAFEGSTAINEVTIPNGVKTIGSRAFANCSGLTLVRIPSTVSSIGTSAFLNDTNVTLVCQSNSVCVSYAQQNGHPYRTE